MDGNGRWASQRGLPRAAGHRRGAEALRRAIEAAPDAGIGTLTFYAFSSDNWRRPPDEVSALMKLLRQYLEREVDECLKNNVRLSFIGRRDRLPAGVPDLMERAERTTAACNGVHVRLAIDYSSRDSMLRAAESCVASGSWTREQMSRHLGSPDVDLLIRTGGEQRLSDFLLWECAYAEFVFLPCLWPDFNATDLNVAVETFRSRDRRFGQAPVERQRVLAG